MERTPDQTRALRLFLNLMEQYPCCLRLFTGHAIPGDDGPWVEIFGRDAQQAAPVLHLSCRWIETEGGAPCAFLRFPEELLALECALLVKAGFRVALVTPARAGAWKAPRWAEETDAAVAEARYPQG